MKSRMFLICLIAAILVMGRVALADEDKAAVEIQVKPLGALVSWLEKAQRTHDALDTYSAEVDVWELNGSAKKGEERVVCSIRTKSFSQYCRWQEGSIYQDLQASYVVKRDGVDYFKALETGLRGIIGVKRWHLDSKIIKALYPHHMRLNQYNLGYLIDHLDTVVKRAIAINKIEAAEQGLTHNEQVGGELTGFAVELSADPADELLYRRMELGFDTKTSLPLVIRLFGFDDKQYACYYVSKVKLNPQLADDIFILKKIER